MEAPAGAAGQVHIRIDHDPVPEMATDVVHRAAVRAVIRHESRLLMVHSRVAGDFKFPGGGLEPGETAHDALAREVSEECGRTVTWIGEVVLTAVEHRRTPEADALFRMESTYHLCGVGHEVHDQDLDAYERDLAFEPVWTTADAAIAANERVLVDGTAQTWVARETAVLRALRYLLDER